MRVKFKLEEVVETTKSYVNFLIKLVVPLRDASTEFHQCKAGQDIAGIPLRTEAINLRKKVVNLMRSVEQHLSEEFGDLNKKHSKKVIKESVTPFYENDLLPTIERIEKLVGEYDESPKTLKDTVLYQEYRMTLLALARELTFFDDTIERHLVGIAYEEHRQAS